MTLSLALMPFLYCCRFSYYLFTNFICKICLLSYFINAAISVYWAPLVTGELSLHFISFHHFTAAVIGHLMHFDELYFAEDTVTARASTSYATAPRRSRCQYAAHKLRAYASHLLVTFAFIHFLQCVTKMYCCLLENFSIMQSFYIRTLQASTFFTLPWYSFDADKPHVPQ